MPSNDLEELKRRAAEKYTDAGADMVIDSINELPEAIKELNRRMER